MNQRTSQSDLQPPPQDTASGSVLLTAPFAEHNAGHFYYAGSDGAQRLDLLLHLAPYSPLLVIAGKPGAGKTALLRQFMSRAQDSWRLALITPRVEMGRDDLLREMARAFGLALDPRIDHQHLYEALVAQLRALRQNAQAPILLLDDAQYLSASMMELILRLCGENDNGHVLSILLFGTPQLQNLLDSPAFTSLAARVTHTFEVTPLDEEETGAYIRHRMRAAGAEDDGPFDAMMINRIYAATGGIPARINESAQRVLSGRPMGEGDRRRGTGGAAAGKRIVLLATAAIIALLMLAGPLRTALFRPAPPKQSASVPAPAPAAPSTSEERVIRNPKNAVPPANEGENLKPLPLPPKADTVPEPTIPPTPTPAPPPPEQKAPSAPREQAPPPEAKSSEPPPARLAAPSESAPPETGAPLSGADWARAQPADHFTLQLMAVNDENTARDFIDRHHLQGKAAYLPVQRDRKVFYAVLYGSYPSRIEAQRVAKALPPKWGAPNPWIRSFKGVHAELPGPQ